MCNYKHAPIKCIIFKSSLDTETCPAQGNWGHHRVGDTNYCYMVIRELTNDWQEAQEMCKEHGADLVTIHNAAENAFLAGFMETASQGRWLGLTTNYKERKYRWIDSTGMGVPSYLNFDGISNRYPLRITTCVEMLESGVWLYEKCSYSRSFTCKKNAPSSGLLFCNVLCHEDHLMYT